MCPSLPPEVTPPRWALSKSAALTWKRFDDEFIVFNAASGDTHLLNVISAEALRCLVECPVTAAELARRVTERLGLPGDPETDRRIAEHRLCI